MNNRNKEGKDYVYQNYEKNLELSAGANEKYRLLIRPKDCYHNIWRIVTSGQFNERYQIAYGYVQAFDHVYVLHCFLVDDHDRVIDPTLPDAGKDNYYILKRFTYQEYLQEVCRSRYPSLENRKWMKQAVKSFTLWGMKNGIVAIS